MAKFRTRPLVIEAVQWFPQMGRSHGVEYNPSDGLYFISTLEGDMIVSAGDWIITGVKGELYPCRDDIFEASYEPVTG